METSSISEGVIAEIVANLLENAFRYSSSKSSIGLNFSEDSLCVWDEGPEIPVNEREKIFKKGFRGDRVVDRSGSGLGLFLGCQLAKELGGDLKLITSPKEFDSGLPFIGNAFVLRLPIKELIAESE